MNTEIIVTALRQESLKACVRQVHPFNSINDGFQGSENAQYAPASPDQLRCPDSASALSRRMPTCTMLLQSASNLDPAIKPQKHRKAHKVVNLWVESAAADVCRLWRK